ncbi:MAG TPA: sigma-70 family RNA polymerase sigma factor [Rhizomicrobium sp.]|jgi:RNA polymerase sigma factor (sigma-70 family)|nr:sigma-70 family RNA polymerase sigma factor [Rhizomicrobium sp.]
MGYTSDTERRDQRRTGAGMTASAVQDWFIREVLPLEAALMQFLQQNWRNKADLSDMRQDIYIQVFDAARKQIPQNTKAFVFQTARHLLIDRIRRNHVIAFEAVPDIEVLGEASAETAGPERNVIARDELRRLQAALDRLPPRCREAVILGRIEGMPGRAIAAHMGISEQAVSVHLANGIRALVNEIYGEEPGRRRNP